MARWLTQRLRQISISKRLCVIVAWTLQQNHENLFKFFIRCPKLFAAFGNLLADLDTNAIQPVLGH